VLDRNQAEQGGTAGSGPQLFGSGPRFIIRISSYSQLFSSFFHQGLRLNFITEATKLQCHIVIKFTATTSEQPNKTRKGIKLRRAHRLGRAHKADHPA
jgi:hypothetical protein